MKYVFTVNLKSSKITVQLLYCCCIYYSLCKKVAYLYSNFLKPAQTSIVLILLHNRFDIRLITWNWGLLKGHVWQRWVYGIMGEKKLPNFNMEIFYGPVEIPVYVWPAKHCAFQNK